MDPEMALPSEAGVPAGLDPADDRAPGVGLDPDAGAAPAVAADDAEPSQRGFTGPDFTAALFRREDMLSLEFEFYNLSLQGQSLVRGSGNAFIVAKFATGGEALPQHIAEESFFEPGGTL